MAEKSPEKSVEKSSGKLKIFVLSLIFVIFIATIFFYKIQEKLMPFDLPKNESKKPEEKAPITHPTPEQNKLEKKDHNDSNKEKEPEKPKSTLTWSEFSQRLKTFEDKRQEVLTQLEQKLLDNPPDNTISSLKTHNIQAPTSDPIEEEKTSWGKVIQHWQQLNEQQQRLSKSNKSD
jgi:hypothetical protein